MVGRTSSSHDKVVDASVFWHPFCTSEAVGRTSTSDEAVGRTPDDAIGDTPDEAAGGTDDETVCGTNIEAVQETVDEALVD